MSDLSWSFVIIALSVVKKYAKTLFIDFSWEPGSLRMRRITWSKARGQKRPDIWNPRPQFVYSLYNFYGATMTIKGTLLSGVPIVSDFQSVFFGQKSMFGALKGVKCHL